MFTISELKTFMESVAPYTYFLAEFPVNAPDEAAFVRIHAGMKPSIWTPLRRPSIQIGIRAKSGLVAEEQARAVYEALHQRSNFTIGSSPVVGCFADQSAPIYVGTDENGRPHYSLNFTLSLLA